MTELEVQVQVQAAAEEVESAKQADAEEETKEEEEEQKAKKCCCIQYLDFGGVPEARGYSTLGIARGALLMSNIVLSTSLIELAAEQAGCSTDDDDATCDNKVYGFSPTSLISNIAVISGLLSALFMPMIGAIVDYTPYRRATGIAAALAMGFIQAAQIGTVQSTWFYMALLQAIAGFIYQVEVVATYAYLPDISSTVGQDKMTTYSSKFVLIQFTAQCLFLILVGAVGAGLGLDNVVTAQMSQAVNCVWIAIFFMWGWKMLPSAPARHTLEDGHSLWTEGFKQNWKTVRTINQDYKHGLRWFLLATTFAEASANAFTTVAVVYLTDSLGMDATQIIIFFLITLVGTIPGTKLATLVTKNTNPKRSWQLSMVTLFLAALIGSLALDGVRNNNYAYSWGAVLGVLLGWFYPTENLFFSMCLPKGQEAELAGFFVYCTQILAWLPPLLFTILVENNVHQKYGVIMTSSFFLVAAALLRFAAPWDEIVAESQRDHHPFNNGNHKEEAHGLEEGEATKDQKEEA